MKSVRIPALILSATLLTLLIVSACKKKENNQPEVNDDLVFNTAITTSVHGGPIEKDCGGFDWKVDFTLDTITPNGGYFIQQITIEQNYITLCPTPYQDILVTYWEAWRVNPGQRISIYREDGSDYDDNYMSGASPNSEGETRYTGILKYFDSVALPPNMIAYNPNTFAGELPSDTIAPPYWANGQGIPHNAYALWDCCDGADTTRYAYEPAPAMIKPKKEISWTQDPFAVNMSELKPWTAEDFNEEDLSAYMTYSREISSMSDQTLIENFEMFEKIVEGDIDELSKLFILSRILYLVPDYYALSDSKVFGGWIRPLPEGESFNLLWPLGSEDGELLLKSRFMGYNGSEYDAVGNLKYFIERFERRPLD